jgi:acyl-CoA hydrolase
MATKVQSLFLVRSEHLNHQGHLFGGDLMAEIDTIAFCLLRQCFGEQSFVTRAAEIGFERPANLGDVIVFEAALAATGETSVCVDVEGLVRGTRICRARMVYVNIGADGKKRPVPKLRP